MRALDATEFLSVEEHNECRRPFHVITVREVLIDADVDSDDPLFPLKRFRNLKYDGFNRSTVRASIRHELGYDRAARTQHGRFKGARGHGFYECCVCSGSHAKFHHLGRASERPGSSCDVRDMLARLTRLARGAGLANEETEHDCDDDAYDQRFERDLKLMK
jgi:hypothetical protein